MANTDLNDRVAVAVQLGKQEAQRLGIEPSAATLIIGIIKEGGCACRILESLGVDLRTVRNAIEKDAVAKAGELVADEPIIVGAKR